MATFTRTSAENRPTTVDIGGVLFVFDGRSIPVCSPDGEKFMYVPLPYPVCDATYTYFKPWTRPGFEHVSGGAGNLTGEDFGWYYAFFNQDLGAFGRCSLHSATSGAIGPLSLSANDCDLSDIFALTDASLYYDFDLYDPTADDTANWQTAIFRNVAGASFAAGEKPPYFLVAKVASTDTTFTDDTPDLALQFEDELRYGAIPCPMFRYSCIHDNRIIGVGFDKYESPASLVLSDTLSDEIIGNAALPALSGIESYAFIPTTKDGDGNYVKPLPEWANIYSSNLAIRVTSGSLIDKVYDVIFTDTVVPDTNVNYYYVVKLISSSDGDTNAKNGTYTFEIVSQYPNAFFFSQKDYPNVFGWGSPVFEGLNFEGYRLAPGDELRGVASSGSCLLILGKNSTSVHMNISDDPDLPNWIQATIDGGVISSWCAKNIEGRLVALGQNGPQYFEPPTKDDALGGYFGKWTNMDGADNHRRCAGVMSNVDSTDFEYCDCVYNARQKTILWTYTTLDVVTGQHGNQQLMYDIQTDSWFIIEGRYMYCLGIGYGDDGEIVNLHGDPWGCVQQDFTETIDGGDASMWSGVSSPQTPYWQCRVLDEDASQTCPNYQDGAGKGYRYQISSSDFKWTYSGTLTKYSPIGVRLYKTTQDAEGNYDIDPDTYQTVVDVYQSGSTYYLYTDGTTSIATTVADATKRIAIAVVHGYVDTPAIEADDGGVQVSEFYARFHPVSDPDSATIYGTSYSNGYVVAETRPKVWPQAGLTDADEMIAPFGAANAKGGQVNIRIGSRSADLKSAIKEIYVNGTGSSAGE